MARLFGPADTTRFRLILLLAPIAFGILVTIYAFVYRNSYYTRESNHIEQPVPFSHAHHVGGLGIDCRYCHTSVETSAFAGMPATATCMRCHSIIWADSPMLEPVRASYRTGIPIRWTRVYDLPDYVYFNHSIHIAKGIGCKTCHGHIDQMPLTAKNESLHMRWCVGCHRSPRAHMGPVDKVFDLSYDPADHPSRQLVKLDLAQSARDDCWICHR